MTAIERYQGPKSTLELAPEAWSLAQRIARTEFVPSALRGKPEAVLACMLAGNEVGVSPMQALSKIHVIDGRPAMAAELMRAIVLREGHELWIEESTSTRCILGGKRKGSDRETRITWTIDDAQRAGLKGRKNWQAYPTAMLLARSTAALCRAIFPDVLAGISYTVEELEDGDVLELDALPPEEGASAPAPPPRARARARQAATRGSGAPEVTEPDPEPKAERELAPLPGEEHFESFERDEHEQEDDVVDAELVEEDDGFDLPPVGEGDEYEGPDQDLTARHYTGPQVIAIKLAELGVTKRDDRLKAISAILGRTITTSKDLDADEVTKVVSTLNELPEGSKLIPEEGPPSEGSADTGSAAGSESAPETPPPGSPEPSSTRRRRAPVVDPEEWDAARWRDFLKARGVKVTEVLREAARLARDTGKPTGTLDDLTGSGIATELVGFVEDLSLERKSS